MIEIYIAIGISIMWLRFYCYTVRFCGSAEFNVTILLPVGIEIMFRSITNTVK